MKYSTLLKISLIISIIGIISLFIINQYTIIKPTPISNINEDLINKNIIIKGEIIKTVSKPTITILTVSDSTGEIQVILFENIKLKNNFVTIEGKVSKYNHQIQINANRIFEQI